MSQLHPTHLRLREKKYLIFEVRTGRKTSIEKKAKMKTETAQLSQKQ